MSFNTLYIKHIYKTNYSIEQSMVASTINQNKFLRTNELNEISALNILY